MFLFRKKAEMIDASDALPGRREALQTATLHHVLKTPLKGPYPAGSERIIVGMGCFWGAERIFWQLGEGIITTAVGYCAGFTPNPTYEEVCSGRTGHNEVVLVVFDPSRLDVERVLKAFWENHDPTQGMRQGNDVGTQYRSGVYTTTPEQLAQAQASKAVDTVPSPLKSSTPLISILPKTTTSSISPRIRAVIAVLAALACVVRLDLRHKTDNRAGMYHQSCHLLNTPCLCLVIRLAAGQGLQSLARD
jgi:peptide-methionine (S)-S-oxide reductase